MNKKNEGFTILELMVGLGLSVILLLCVASAANGFFKTYNSVKDTSSIYPRLSTSILWQYDSYFNYEDGGSQDVWEVSTATDSTKFLHLTTATAGEGVLLDGAKSAEAGIVPNPPSTFLMDIYRIKTEFENPFDITLYFAFPRPK